MAFRSYNNNQNQISNTTYTGIAFSNPASKIGQTKLSVSYFNKVMKISIALRNNANSSDEYATYDNDNAVTVYVSLTKAKILTDMISYMKENKDVHNVCIELKNGLLKVSDGSEYGSSSPCISISYARDIDAAVSEIIYQTKEGFYTGAYNYKDGKYETKGFDDMELDTFQMCLEEYYKASSYAIAATVMEANMYKRNAIVEMLKAISDAVGASVNSNKGGGNFNNKTFLSNDGGESSNSTSGFMNQPIPKEYEASTFEDIVNSMED